MFVAQLLAFEMRVAAAHVRAARGRGRFFFADGLGFLVCFHGEIGFWKAPTALTKRRFPITFCALPCRDGEIGRRTRFRSWRWQHCGGSSPLLGTSNPPQRPCPSLRRIERMAEHDGFFAIGPGGNHIDWHAASLLDTLQIMAR